MSVQEFAFGVPAAIQEGTNPSPQQRRAQDALWQVPQEGRSPVIILTPYDPVSVSNTAWMAMRMDAQLAVNYQAGIAECDERLAAGAAWLKANPTGHPRRKEALHLRHQLSSRRDDLLIAYHAALAQAWVNLARVLYAVSQMDAEQLEAADFLPVFMSLDTDEVWASLMNQHPPFNRDWLQHILLAPSPKPRR